MFRLAHLSDPHLGPLPQARLAELASKRMLGYVNWRVNRGRGGMRPVILESLVADIRAARPDHTVVTGDIVNLALAAEMRPSRDWLDTIGVPGDVSVVPGNHDAYVKGALGAAGESWAPFMSGDETEHIAFPYVRRRGPLAIVGVSSAVPTAPFMATGVFDASQALLLSETLERLGHDGAFRVVLIHHPPIRRETPWGGRLIGADRFNATIRAAGAELILHGHTHRSSLNWLQGRDGAVPVVGVPSASRAPGRHNHGAGWNLFGITGKPGAWTLERVERGFRREDGPAVERSRTLLIDKGVARQERAHG